MTIPDMSVGEFLELSLMSMFEQQQVESVVDVMHKGGLYRLHMYVVQVAPPEDPDLLMGREH